MIPQAPTGRNNAAAHFALSGLPGSSCCSPGARHRAISFRPVGAEQLHKFVVCLTFRIVPLSVSSRNSFSIIFSVRLIKIETPVSFTCMGETDR